MRKQFLIPLILSGFSFCSCDSYQESEKELNPSLVLWYDEPASEWTEALPVGNGRLGAMIYGGIKEETIQFNEETLWTGQPHDYAHDSAYEVLDELRKLLWNGKQNEAHRLASERFMSQPVGQFSYQPCGNISLVFPDHIDATDYVRKLDLESALSTINYKVNNVRYRREIFASEPDQAIVIHIESSKRGELNFIVGLNSPHSKHDVTVDGEEIVLTGRANNYPEELERGGFYPESKLTFEAHLKVINKGGKLEEYERGIKIINANSATLILVAATSYVNFQDISAEPAERCRQHMINLNSKTYKQLIKRHTEDYKALFSRVYLDLGSSEISYRPTDERLISFKHDEDPCLISLLYQYGRYLLISSSREGTQPANLQGIWNDKLTPPWDSKYTININTEMNYWPAEVTNLSELSDPLIRMTEELTISGKNVARKHYNLNGWVTHHNTDLWRGAAPINNSNHGIWVTGGAWLCQHLWWHYQFTGDIAYLRNVAYPVLKNASVFFTEYLVPDPNNPAWLVSGPSNSPELGGLVMAPTMDHQIIRNLLGNTIEAAEVLNVDREFTDKLIEVRSKIAPNLIGRYGQLQEWLIDKDDPHNQHRHVSHLWGLFPGNEIHPLITPELAEASKITLSHRGDGGTGWSRAWKINFWARLLDGDHSFRLLKNLMVPAYTELKDFNDKGGLYLNLFCAHPPFQIDGNFGATSGITEMILQSHLRDNNGDYYQDLLPALPSKLKRGEVSGIKGRGGFEFTIQWDNNTLVSVVVMSNLGNKLNLRFNGKLISVETSPGKTYSFLLEDFR